MKEKDPAILFYPSDWLTSTTAIGPFARGIYIQLLMNQAVLGSLPNDIEELALLAGVKFSDFEAFKHAFEHTLKAKFKKNSDGKLFNEKLQHVMNQRKEYSSKQRKRGTIGALMKKAFREHKLNKTQQASLREILINNNIYDLPEEKSINAFKHTLKAFIESVDVNENIIIDKDKNHNGGSGEISTIEAVNVTMPFGEEFNNVWEQWKSYMSNEHNYSYNSPQSQQGALKILTDLTSNEEDAIKIVIQSIGRGWKSFYELKNNNKKSNNNGSSDLYREEFIKKHTK